VTAVINEPRQQQARTARPATTGDRPLFPERVRRVRLNDVDRLLEGVLDTEPEGYCDGDVGCPALHHSSLCRAAGDPLRSSGSIRATRLG
jgi:hypothetical protein